jgi:hypothetical protein
MFSLLRVLPALARAKNTFWANPCLSLAFSLPARQPALTGVTVAQRWGRKPIVEAHCIASVKRGRYWNTLSSNNDVWAQSRKNDTRRDNDVGLQFKNDLRHNSESSDSATVTYVMWHEERL